MKEDNDYSQPDYLYRNEMLKDLISNHSLKGLKKDEALQEAKIDYLNSSEIDTRFKSPAYWAHLVLIGDQQELVSKSYKWYFFIAAMAVMILVAIFFIKRQGKNNCPVFWF